MNCLKPFLWILIVVCTNAGAHTPEEGKVSALVGPLLFRTNFGGDCPQMESPYLGSFGIIAEGDLNKHGGLEIGMLYLPKLFFRQTGAYYLVERIKLMYITMGYRRWFKPNFSAALALFSSYAMGDPTIVHQDSTTLGPTDTSARDTTEYGLDLSLQWEFWAQDKFAGVLDFRYSRSLTSKDHEDADHYAGLVGLRYQIQEKGKPNL